MSADTGSTHVLEAILIASIMISAVAFVVTFEQPPTSAGDVRTSVATRTRDALDVLYDTPVDDSAFGSDALSAYIAECLNDRCTDLEERLERLLPSGAAYALYLSNGYDTYPVIVQGEPVGEAVAASKTFEPQWSSTFLATATESIGTNDALLVYALPIFHSTPVSPGGSQLLVKVSGLREDGSRYALLASAATVAQEAGDPTAKSAAMYFVGADDAPLPVHDISAISDAPQRILLRVEETEATGTIPAGTQVEVHIPRGWTAQAPDADNPLWTIEANADDPDGAHVGSLVRATLASELTIGHADLAMDFTYHEDVLDVYPVVATLSRGAYGVASMLLKGDEHGTPPELATPLLHMSVPSPMGAAAQTTWTLSAHIPAGETDLPGGLSGIVHIDTIEIVEQDGNAIFGDVTADEGQEGTWVNGGDSLVWTGDVEMNHDTFLNLTFHVTASGTPGPAEARAQFVPPVTFDDWTGRLVGRTGWGFYRQALLPESEDYAGYNTDTGALSEEHPLTTDATYRQASLPGAITYETSTLAAVKDSLYGSYVTAEDRTVPVGGEVVINADVQSLLFALTEAGQTAGVTLRFYPPWSGDEREPIFEQENLDNSLLSGEVSQLVTLDLNGDGYVDPIIGTTNGRIIAFHALTGQRLQGNTYNVPLTTAAEQQEAVAEITALATINLYGEDYVVIGTDSNSNGIFVLDTDFNLRWSYSIGAGDTLALDTSADIDLDGQNDIVAARSYDIGASHNALVYAFHAPNDPDEDELEPILAADPPVQDSNALYYSLGTPTTILGQDHVGPWGSGPGVLVPIQTLADPGIQIDMEAFPPELTQGASSTPRAGVQGMDAQGVSTSTLFGAPASVLRTFDQDGDDVDDVVLGGASGYVIMANGRALTQPIYSYIMTPTTAFISADTRSSSESYTLTSEGQIAWTDDAWVTSYLGITPATGGNAIAARDYNDYWVVGDSNAIWKSYDPGLPLPPDETMAHMPTQKEIQSVVPTMTRAGVPWAFGANVYDLQDVRWYDEDEGFIVGTACALALCSEPIALRTGDGGDNWIVITKDDDTLLANDGGQISDAIRRVRIMEDGIGWMVGANGLVVRSDATRETWTQLPVGYEGALDTTADLYDIACKPSDAESCIAVGAEGTAFATQNAGDAFPIWSEIGEAEGLPSDRTLYTVGFAEDDRAYIGTTNMVLARFDDADWTTLPLNYFPNDAYVVSTPGDGTGFVYGGTAATGRIWLLHDYATQSQAQTVSLTPELAGKAITEVTLVTGNVTFGQQTIDVEVATSADDWQELGTLSGGTDTRLPSSLDPVPFVPLVSGSDFRVRIALNTSGDKTVLSPQIRALEFDVDWVAPDASSGTTRVALDLDTTDQMDADATTAAWDVEAGSIHQAFIQEFWTRNVSGEVLDLQTGFDVAGTDGIDEVWVGTGDVLAENSPDHIIYNDPSAIVEPHNRIYLLDGANGDPLVVTDPLDGEVRQLRLVDQDGVGGPEVLFAATWNSEDADGHGTLYALHPTTLAIEWSLDLGREVPSDMEIGKFAGPERAVFIGAQRPASEAAYVPHLWAVSETTQQDEWSVLPDDMGSYLITTTVEPGWLFGPYVVEIEVVWEDTATEVGASMTWPDGTPAPPGTPPGTTVLRSARFYDHFMVTPHDAVSPPNPIYTARLLVWLRDWS